MRRFDKLKKSFPFLAHFHVYRVSLVSVCCLAAPLRGFIIWKYDMRVVTIVRIMWSAQMFEYRVCIMNMVWCVCVCVCVFVCVFVCLCVHAYVCVCVCTDQLDWGCPLGGLLLLQQDVRAEQIWYRTWLWPGDVCVCVWCVCVRISPPPWGMSSGQRHFSTGTSCCFSASEFLHASFPSLYHTCCFCLSFFCDVYHMFTRLCYLLVVHWHVLEMWRDYLESLYSGCSNSHTSIGKAIDIAYNAGLCMWRVHKSNNFFIRDGTLLFPCSVLHTFLQLNRCVTLQAASDDM